MRGMITIERSRLLPRPARVSEDAIVGRSKSSSSLINT